MPMYEFRSTRDGLNRLVVLGFFRDHAAVEHARKLAWAADVEVWRENTLLARVEAASEPDAE